MGWRSRKEEDVFDGLEVTNPESSFTPSQTHKRAIQIMALQIEDSNVWSCTQSITSEDEHLRSEKEQ